jgi:hypothetical protein
MPAWVGNAGGGLKRKILAKPHRLGAVGSVANLRVPHAGRLAQELQSHTNAGNATQL